MDAILELVHEYGAFIYLLLFLYCALKSGILPLFAGVAAQAGALDIGLVAAATFAGGYLGDEARFHVARRYGTRWLEMRPRFNRMLATTRILAERYGAAYVFLYRYPKGLRTIGSLPMGLTTIASVRFATLNAASAALWTLVMTGGGYWLGASIQDAVEGGWTGISLGLLGVFLVCLAFAWWRVGRMVVAGAVPAEVAPR